MIVEVSSSTPFILAVPISGLGDMDTQGLAVMSTGVYVYVSGVWVGM